MNEQAQWQMIPDIDNTLKEEWIVAIKAKNKDRTAVLALLRSSISFTRRQVKTETLFARNYFDLKAIAKERELALSYDSDRNKQIVAIVNEFLPVPIAETTVVLDISETIVPAICESPADFILKSNIPKWSGRISKQRAKELISSFLGDNDG